MSRVDGDAVCGLYEMSDGLRGPRIGAPASPSSPPREPWSGSPSAVDAQLGDPQGALFTVFAGEVDP
jgi:hypothetical protein